MIQSLFLQNKNRPELPATEQLMTLAPKLPKYSYLHPGSFLHALNIYICLKAHTDDGSALNKGTR